KWKLFLSSHQKAILFIDAWSVHQLDEFMGWMKQNYPYIKVTFVPAGCTGKLQPADVGLQCVIKH
ncbi:hypothetical protein BS47DRAFT_1255428, partial [Hydnum rufescens UP504]